MKDKDEMETPLAGRLFVLLSDWLEGLRMLAGGAQPAPICSIRDNGTVSTAVVPGCEGTAIPPTDIPGLPEDLTAGSIA
jgi:hypothetical protein